MSFVLKRITARWLIVITGFLRACVYYFICLGTKADPGDDEPFIKSLTIKSKVMMRFSRCEITTEMYNPSSGNQEARFLVQLPNTAFISNFTMEINGNVVVAQVKSKQQAEDDYKEAKDQNKTAGYVGVSHPTKPEKGMQVFEILTTVHAGGTVIFQLSYEELLIRELKWYQQRISIRPHQLVNTIKAELYIYEPQGFSEFYVLNPSDNAVGQLNVITRDENVKHVLYEVNREQQEEIGGSNGIKGELILKYDVRHSSDVGLVHVEDDYFVHLISPENGFSPLAKNIIFVIDISGSMGGHNKIFQAKLSLKNILTKLRSFDKFMCVFFHTDLIYWPSRDDGLVFATVSNIVSAQTFIEMKMVANGGTNINDALVRSASFLNNIPGPKGSHLIVFLTDGKPSEGVTIKTDIVRNVIYAASSKVSIFSLGFGSDHELDFELLQMLSYRTGGYAKRILPTDGSREELTNFFLGFNTPLLYDIKLDYTKSVVDDNLITPVVFRQYFEGSELVVAGKLRPESPSTWNVSLLGFTTELVKLSKVVNSKMMEIPDHAYSAYNEGFVKKLYAYWRIKKLLEDELETDDVDEKINIREMALQLALENNFVTPLTSMIVVDNQMYDQDDTAKEAHFPSGANSSFSEKLNPFIHIILVLQILLFYMKPF